MLIALGGGLLAAAQALLIVLQGNILCLNDGCEVVEKLTNVPPIAFNMAGSLYFMTIFFALWQSARGIRGWLSLAQVLLLAGMAAEGVLVCFQQYIAQVFCSYCLIILSIIGVLNILMGWRQVLASIAVFGSVVLAFSSLQFTPYSDAGGASLERGVYGHLALNTSSGEELSLFFSSTCPHCEDVIQTIDADFTCNLNFNPIDRLEEKPLSGIILNSEYFPDKNMRYLKELGIAEIPVLVVKGDRELRVLKGKQMILEFLDNHCRSESIFTETSSEAGESSGQSSIFSYVSPREQEDGCFVGEDCEPETAKDKIAQ